MQPTEERKQRLAASLRRLGTDEATIRAMLRPDVQTADAAGGAGCWTAPELAGRQRAGHLAGADPATGPPASTGCPLLVDAELLNRRNSSQPREPGRSTASSSPPRSVHRSSPATCYGASRSSRSEPASAASPCTPCGTPRRASCWRLNAHQGRPGAPGPLVVRHHGGHLQPRRSGAAARGRRPARPGAPLVTVAVPRAALLYALL